MDAAEYKQLFAGPVLLDDNGAMSDVTRIVSQIESRDPSEAEKLVPQVCEAPTLSAAKFALEKPS